MTTCHVDHLRCDRCGTRLVGLPSAAIAAARCSTISSGGISFIASMIPSGNNQLVQIA
jgi:hypothetical protein